MVKKAPSSDISIRFNYCGAVGPDPSWKMPDHAHDFFEFIVVLSGKAKVRYDGVMHDVSGPCVLVYEPGKRHEERADANDPWSSRYCSLSIAGRGGAAPDIFRRGEKGLIIITGRKEFSAAAEVLKAMLKEDILRGFGWREVLKGYAFLLVRSLMNRENEPKEETGKVSGVQVERRRIIIDRVKAHINANITEKITLKELTGIAFLSQFYLSHMFKEETGYAPIKYIIKMKMEHAKKMLKDPSLTVSQAAIRTGYESIHYFSRLFTETEGVTPSAYREKIFKKRVR